MEDENNDVEEDELVSIIINSQKLPLGPEDYSSANFLLGKHILCAQGKEYLGSYGKLVKIDPARNRGPYGVRLSWNRKKIYYFKWIVKEGGYESINY